MSDVAIRVEKLGKLYFIGATQRRHDTLRDALVYRLRAPIEHFSCIFHHPPSPDGDGRRTIKGEHIWALKDVSFEVKRGQVVGIVGRNGAGKSTLLKVLSRITEPTTGRAVIDGRVGSLLEVGTGFHPELTGRENIYLNGAILGMKRVEIDHKFDEIVAFAEIEKFLDTPVKHYSSGMYVRLAFAVAAHLEPEVLLVDEVLAVGDAAFQTKCLGKIGDVAKEGRTVLFVSHNIAVVGQMCQRAFYLDRGVIKSDGVAAEVVMRYYRDSVSTSACLTWPEEEAPKCQDVILQSVRAMNSCDERTTAFSSAEPIAIEIDYVVSKQTERLALWIELSTRDGIDVFSTPDGYSANGAWSRPPGPYTSRCIIPGNLLNIGSYFVNIVVSASGMTVINALPVLSVEIRDRGEDLGSYPVPVKGIVRPKVEWSLKRNDNYSVSEQRL
jgi:lipopolysaccharide transport system ATP-binding protein